MADMRALKSSGAVSSTPSRKVRSWHHRHTRVYVTQAISQQVTRFDLRKKEKRKDKRLSAAQAFCYPHIHHCEYSGIHCLTRKNRHHGFDHCLSAYTVLTVTLCHAHNLKYSFLLSALMQIHWHVQT